LHRDEVVTNFDALAFSQSNLPLVHCSAFHFDLFTGTGDDEESRSWIGFVESRIGRLPQFLESLPLKHPIHFYPVPSRTQQSPNSLCYFIGFEIDQKLAARGDKNIHIDHCAYNFQ
jgi:hypothetical protein